MPPEADPDLEHEELETIPWEMLAEHMGRRRFAAYARYAGAAVVFVVVVIVGLALTRNRPGTVVEASAAPARTTTSAEVGVETTPPGTGPEATSGASPAPGVPPSPGLYSEADLMAVLPPELDDASNAIRRAAQAAEWFVIDYFTSDAAEPPASWVEWAVAGDVDLAGDDLHDVTVAFQTLLLDGEGTYRRADPQVVRIAVETGEGVTSVVDLPRPASFEDMFDIVVPDPPAGSVSDEVAAVAVRKASSLGVEPEVIGGEQLDDGSWHVVVTVADAVGQRRSIAVVVPG